MLWENNGTSFFYEQFCFKNCWFFAFYLIYLIFCMSLHRFFMSTCSFYFCANYNKSLITRLQIGYCYYLVDSINLEHRLFTLRSANYNKSLLMVISASVLVRVIIRKTNFFKHFYLFYLKKDLGFYFTLKTLHFVCLIIL